MEHASAKSSGKSERKPFKLPFKALLIGGVMATVLFFVILVLFAAILPAIGARDAWLPYIAVITGGISAFIASYVAAKSAGQKGMLTGFGCALIEMLLLCLILIIAAKGLGMTTVFLAAALFGCGAAGGVFGVQAYSNST